MRLLMRVWRFQRSPIHDPWKRRRGVEFSGLERPRDFLIGPLFFAAMLTIAAIIAWALFADLEAGVDTHQVRVERGTDSGRHQLVRRPGPQPIG
jgi:hypothetical protein